MRFRGEFVFNLILMTCGLAIVVVSLQIGFGTFKKPGSGLFPFFCGLIVFLMNTILLWQKSQRSQSTFVQEEVKKFIWMIGPFILWILLMPLFGYVLMTFLSTFALSKILKLEGWRKPLILSLGTMGLCYFLFDYCLYLDLPRGFLTF